MPTARLHTFTRSAPRGSSLALGLAALWLIASALLGWVALLLVPNQGLMSALAIASFVLVPGVGLWIIARAGESGGVPLILMVVAVVVVSDLTARGGIRSGFDAQSVLKFAVWASGLVLVLWRGALLKRALAHPPTAALFVFGVWATLTTTFSSIPVYTFAAGVSFLGIWVIATSFAAAVDERRGLLVISASLLFALALSLLLYLVIPDRVMTPMEGGKILRLSGLFGSPNNMGRAAALALLLTVLLWRVLNRGTAIWVTLVSLAICGSCLYLSGSRASALGLVVGVAIVFLGRRPFWTSAAAVVAICATLLYFFEPLARDAVVAAISRSGSVSEVTTFTGRTEIWSFVMSMIEKSWLLGYGFASTRDLIPAGYFGAFGWTTTSAHNLWLQVWITTGLIGLVVVVSGQLAWLREAVQRHDPIRDAVVAFVLVVGLFEASAFGPSINLLTFMLVWATALGMHRRNGAAVS